MYGSDAFGTIQCILTIGAVVVVVDSSVVEVVVVVVVVFLETQSFARSVREIPHHVMCVKGSLRASLSDCTLNSINVVMPNSLCSN